MIIDVFFKLYENSQLNPDGWTGVPACRLHKPYLRELFPFSCLLERRLTRLKDMVLPGLTELTMLYCYLNRFSQASFFITSKRLCWELEKAGMEPLPLNFWEQGGFSAWGRLWLPSCPQ